MAMSASAFALRSFFVLSGLLLLVPLVSSYGYNVQVGWESTRSVFKVVTTNNMSTVCDVVQNFDTGQRWFAAAALPDGGAVAVGMQHSGRMVRVEKFNVLHGDPCSSVWNYIAAPAGEVSALAVAYGNGLVYAAGYDNAISLQGRQWHVWALDATTGQLIWQYTSNPSNRDDMAKAIVYADGYVYVGGNQYNNNIWRIEKLNAATGSNVLNYTSDPISPGVDYLEALAIDPVRQILFAGGSDNNRSGQMRIEPISTATMTLAGAPYLYDATGGEDRIVAMTFWKGYLYTSAWQRGGGEVVLEKLSYASPFTKIWSVVKNPGSEDILPGMTIYEDEDGVAWLIFSGAFSAHNGWWVLKINTLTNATVYETFDQRISAENAQQGDAFIATPTPVPTPTPVQIPYCDYNMVVGWQSTRAEVEAFDTNTGLKICDVVQNARPDRAEKLYAAAALPDGSIAAVGMQNSGRDWWVEQVRVSSGTPCSVGWTYVNSPGGDAEALDVAYGNGLVYAAGYDDAVRNGRGEEARVEAINAVTGLNVWNYTSDPSNDDDNAKAIAFDSAGFVYVAISQERNKLWRVEKLNAATGQFVQAYTSDPSTGLDYVEGIAFDPAGYIAVVGSDNVGSGRIRVEKIATSTMTLVGPPYILDASNGEDRCMRVAYWNNRYYTSCWQNSEAKVRLEALDAATMTRVWEKVLDPASGPDILPGIAVAYMPNSLDLLFAGSYSHHNAWWLPVLDALTGDVKKDINEQKIGAENAGTDRVCVAAQPGSHTGALVGGVDGLAYGVAAAVLLLLVFGYYRFFAR